MDERGGIPGALRAEAFRRLFVGQAVSALGDWVATVAFIAAAFELTGSPTAVAGVLVLRLVPPIFAAPLGGILADRLDRRVIMVSSNLAMGALIALAPFVGLAGLYVIALVSESINLVFLPTRDATVPDLVDARALPTANGLLLGASYGSIPVAAALFSGLRLASEHLPGWVPFAELLRAHPLALPFLFDTATFVFAAVVFAGLSIPRRRGGARTEAIGGVREGLRFARGSPAIRGLAAGVGTAMLGGGVLFAVGIAYVRETLGAGDVEFGFLVATWGLGMALGIATVHLLVRRGEGALFQAAALLCGGILIAMAVLPVVWLALMAALVFGMGFSVALMLAVTLVQRIATEELRGRLMGAAHMLFRGALAVGALGVGGVASALGPVTVGAAGLELRLDGNQLGLLLGGGLIVVGSLAAAGVRHGT